jgi:hypothetical protein
MSTRCGPASEPHEGGDAITSPKEGAVLLRAMLTCHTCAHSRYCSLDTSIPYATHCCGAGAGQADGRDAAAEGGPLPVRLQPHLRRRLLCRHAALTACSVARSV